MSLLTEGSRESLSSLFDLVFCSWALIWCQWAQAKSSVWLLKVLNFIEKCPGHFTAIFMHFSFPDKPKPMLKEPWAFQGLFMSSDRSFELVGSFPESSSWYGLRSRYICSKYLGFWLTFPRFPSRLNKSFCTSVLNSLGLLSSVPWPELSPGSCWSILNPICWNHLVGLPHLIAILNISSRESLSSLFDLIFCSWALIWAQKAQARSLDL